ncbi:hypothetical protein C8A05DRAFT_35861 [Staphylotrichum tortipilum]|uniref:SRR1-like domain-containing protein n=1 Tax=Staphylotrichum tortipilum TaxID=2831512 RepID=A0AAN6MGM3_9PEZI|nr:hypothetical protein C8A05DRAFT_35861 [Staphylotrichum longicolle]
MPSQDDGSWNQVARKRGRLRHLPAPTTTNEAADSLADGTRSNPYPELSVDDLWRYHQTVTKDWQTTSWWEQLHHVLESASAKTGAPSVTTAVCLGPGPYEPSTGSARARRTAHLQTAAFCAVVEYLKSKTGQDIKCMVQEPRFTTADKEFCARLGLEAVDSPDAFGMVDGSTLVFGIHMELEIYNLALKTLPAVFVGASLEEWERVVLSHQGEGEEDPLRAFKKMEEGWDRFGFPDLEYMFSSTVMYWRRGAS